MRWIRSKQSEGVRGQPRAHENFGFESAETPMQFRTRIRKTLEAAIRLTEGLCKLAQSCFLPAAIEGSSWVGLAGPEPARIEQNDSQEEGYYQGWPLVLVPVAVPEAAVEEPRSKRSMVSDFSPYLIRSSPR